jgi:hypothetical protein
MPATLWDKTLHEIVLVIFVLLVVWFLAGPMCPWHWPGVDVYRSPWTKSGWRIVCWGFSWKPGERP